MTEDYLLDMYEVIDFHKSTWKENFHLQDFDLSFLVTSTDMPIKFKFDVKYLYNDFSFSFRLFSHQYSSKKTLENLVIEKVVKLLKTVRNLLKEKNFIKKYGEEYRFIIEKKWLNRKLNRKLIPKLKTKVIKI